MARGRAANYDEQRALIQARAAALFARHGYLGTSMNQVAQACTLSKATLYHYYADKHSLLASIADAHVSRLVALVEAPLEPPLAGAQRLRQLIDAIMREYAGAQHAHRVLTEDVKFLDAVARESILAKERRVVAAFAAAVGQARGAGAGQRADPLAKPLTMLLFGMVNWLFTWLKPDGRLDHAALAPMVAELFLHGVEAVPPAPLLESSPQPEALSKQ